MALPKKGTRSITVQQKTYRWVVSSAGQGMLVVTIQSAGEAGQLIRVYMKADVPRNVCGDGAGRRFAACTGAASDQAFRCGGDHRRSRAARVGAGEERDAAQF